jgi:hypothetical protein
VDSELETVLSQFCRRSDDDEGNHHDDEDDDDGNHNDDEDDDDGNHDEDGKS